MNESKRSKKRRPTHPGEILREDILPELGITQGDFARELGVSRRTVSEIILERRPVTPDIAIRLSRYLGTTTTIWLSMQQALDVWKLEKSNKHLYLRIKANKHVAGGTRGLA